MLVPSGKSTRPRTVLETGLAGAAGSTTDDSVGWLGFVVAVLALALTWGFPAGPAEERAQPSPVRVRVKTTPTSRLIAGAMLARNDFGGDNGERSRTNGQSPLNPIRLSSSITSTPQLEMRPGTPLVYVGSCSQLRQRIGVVYGNPETTASNALKFYASARLDVARPARSRTANRSLATGRA
jgi:hypothetical protein